MSPEVSDYRQIPANIWTAVQFCLMEMDREFTKRDIHQGVGFYTEEVDGRMIVSKFTSYNEMGDGQRAQARKQKSNWWALLPIDGRSKNRKEYARVYGDNDGTPDGKPRGGKLGRGNLRQKSAKGNTPPAY